MHVPDGFLDAPTSVATGVAAAAAIGVALRGARRELDDRTAPLAGLVAAFVFAGQMVTFPVASGTSGHLLGGALAAVLVGPYTAVLCTSVVLLVQALLFADGGITALGTNIVLMAVITCTVGWLTFRLLQVLTPPRLSWVPALAALAAFTSVVAASAAFVVLYAVGGSIDLPLERLGAAMVGVYSLIGIGEAVITFLAVGSIVAVRPDLVYGARPVLARRQLELRQPGDPS